MKQTTYYIALCGLFDGDTEQPYVERFNGEDDPKAVKADVTFWTLYVRKNGGPSLALADYATRAGAQAALIEAMDDGPKLSDPLGHPPISTSDFFASYTQKYH